LLSDNLLPNPTAGGRLRRIAVGIHDSVYHPLELPPLIEECFQQIVDTGAAIQNPFEQAFFAMVHLPYLQPFEDVNKRVSRLAANIPFIRENLSPLSFIDVPEGLRRGTIGCLRTPPRRAATRCFCMGVRPISQTLCGSAAIAGEPDKFRLKFRNELTEVVGNIVRGGLALTVEAVTRVAREHVPAEHLDDFVRMTINDLENLHEGNFARFRLRPSEFHAWSEMQRRPNEHSG
jgi:hypothetical protein